MPPTPQQISSPLAAIAHSHVDELSATNHLQQDRDDSQVEGPAVSKGDTTTTATNDSSNTGSNEEESDKNYISKIGILTSSLPVYHNAFMAEKAKDAQPARLREQGEPLEPHEAGMLSKMSLTVGNGEQTSDEQAETIRRLKPHSRSTIQLQNITSGHSIQDGVVLDVRKKQKSPKWQFGIRSRNEPVDAIKCLYTALVSMGDCQWHISPPNKRSMDSEYEGGPYPVTVQGATHLTAAESTLSESPEKNKHHPRSIDHVQSNPQNNFQGSNDQETPEAVPDLCDSESENDDDVDPTIDPADYAPKDPWCINVRWEKKDMSPPGAATTSSARSSAVDLNSDAGHARRLSTTLGSLSSVAGSVASLATSEGPINTNTACFVYMDLQIYVLEPNTYLVDFKSAGYEPIIGERQVRNRKGQMITEFIGNGQRKSDKDVTSPQPFMDLANKLVIHLAKGAREGS